MDYLNSNNVENTILEEQGGRYYTSTYDNSCKHQKSIIMNLLQLSELIVTRSSLYCLNDNYMCFRRNSLLNLYGRLISNHWLRPVRARYLLYAVPLYTLPMLLCFSRDKEREVPSVEPSFEHIFDRRSVA